MWRSARFRQWRQRFEHECAVFKCSGTPHREPKLGGGGGGAALGRNAKTTDNGHTYPSLIITPPLQKLLSCSESCGSCGWRYRLPTATKTETQREGKGRKCQDENSIRHAGPNGCERQVETRRYSFIIFASGGALFSLKPLFRPKKCHNLRDNAK